MTQGDRLFVECACSRTGKSWTATLDRHGDIWVYSGHYDQEGFANLQRQMKHAQRQEVLKGLAALSAGETAALPPPEQFELRPALRQVEITSDNLSPYGFMCPHCNESKPLICPQCHRISCMGDIDVANRTVCIRCNTTLVFGGTGGTAAAAPIAIQPMEATLQATERALSRADAPKLLPPKR